MKRILLLSLSFLLLTASIAQINLSGTSYTQNFDGIGSGLPTGFSIAANATATSLGTAATFTTAATAWNSTASGFKNFASADGLVSSSSSTIQTASADRALGVRQSGSFGDPGAAIEMQLANTNGFTGFSMNFKLQSLDVSSPRTTTFLVDYGFGASPTSFTTIGTTPATITTGGLSFTNTAVTINFGTALDNINQPVWIRIIALATSSGSGNRATTGIDDIALSFTGGTACTAPTTQATAAALTNITNNSFDINWTAGNGTNSLVVVKAATAVSGLPASGTAYTPNTVFGTGQTIAGGEYVVYAATGNTVSVTGLSNATTYHVAVFTYNSADNCYNTTAATTANGTTLCVAPTTQATSFTITPSVTSGTISWVKGDGTNTLLLINNANTFTTPVDGTSYTPNTVYSGAGEQVIYTGTGTSVSVTGLTSGITYYVQAYNFSNCPTTPDYVTTSPLAGQFTTTSAAGYYSSITTQTCATLKTDLSNLITSGHIQLNYGDLDNIQMPATDDHLSDDGLRTIIWDMYSDNPSGAEPYEYTFSALFNGGSTNTESQGWNKEHSFPNSWFSATSSTSNFPGADLHHLFPTDKAVNFFRGNMPYGKVATASQTFLNGSKVGSSAIAFAGYSGTVFEPIDAYKGDLARAIFYMVTRYQTSQSAWESLQTGGDVVMDGLTYPSIELDYLNMLLSWHAADPVSAKEIDRNNEIFGFQSNRNPFVDHPEYVTAIWSSSCGLALPVDLLSFNATYLNDKAVLQWKVDRADGFSHFEIERSTDGGVSYKLAGTVGWVIGKNDYLFTDDVTAFDGTVYYRLKMIDNNQVYKYSKNVSVKLPSIQSLSLVYPNPANDKLTILFRNTNKVQWQAIVTDYAGRKLQQITIKPGQSSYIVPLQNLPAGAYLLQLQSINNNKNTSFFIQR